ncbi:unnamed protein product [Rotaria socialis]|uniref:G-protein coupled receptors family 1 profile domain-containing protein n=3 Tax=Rotaria socialis TaxID=392032 RepID=A0A817YKL4_9BILA|nr:unnamed protein product [Rotaria socialis]
MPTTTLSSSMITTTLATVQIVTSEMTYYGPIILLVIGIFGCMCNFITFTAPQLRNNSCAFYFLMSAVFELVSISFGLISRFADHLGSTLINTSSVYCKLRVYLVSVLPLIATYFILLSSIDRCMSSSVSARLRSFSQMKIAYRATLVAILIGFLSCIHILIAYDLRPRCGVLNGSFSIFDGMFVVFWLGIIPHTLMFTFGFLTFMNVRRTKRRIANKPSQHTGTVVESQRRQERTDTQLIVMMFFQVGFSELLVLTRMIYYAYYVLAPPLTGYNRLIGSFLMSFTTLVYYANFTKSFYIYTLSSHLFRSIFMDRIKFFLRKALGRYNPALSLERSITRNGTTMTLH